MSQSNLSIILAERPTNEIILGRTFTQKITPIPTRDELRDGEILVEVLFLSIDATMRGWIEDTRSYYPPVQVGDVMRGQSVGRVLASKSSLAQEGDFTSANTGWTRYAIVSEGNFEPASSFPATSQPQEYLSALGITSLTAWVGMTKIGKPKPGDLVVVSGAAGATGSIAGQIAKIKGAKVIGIAGSDEKCRWLTDTLGFDLALNYKARDFKERFNKATDKLIDLYYDNVGGEILDLCLRRAKPHARFVECGTISQYNTNKPQGPEAFFQVIAMRIKMEGFIIIDHIEDFPQAREELAQWMAEGKLKKAETIVQGGLEVAEQALANLYIGINTGKLLVEVKSPSEPPKEL